MENTYWYVGVTADMMRIYNMVCKLIILNKDIF